jgi:hypothetical protein
MQPILASSYTDAMHVLNTILYDYLSEPEASRFAVDNVRKGIHALDLLEESCALRLKSVAHCSNLQQTLQYYALRMHLAFFNAEICRPYLFAARQGASGDDAIALGERAIERMRTTVEAYLDMSRLTILPLRSWSLIHEALSCACVLALLRATRNDHSVQILLDKVTSLLESELELAGPAPQNGNWTIHRALRLLKASREAKEQASAAPLTGNEHPTPRKGSRNTQNPPTGDGTHGQALLPGMRDLSFNIDPEISWSGPSFDDVDIPLSTFFDWSGDLLQQYDLSLPGDQEGA